MSGVKTDPQDRWLAGVILLVSFGLVVAASSLGGPSHALAPKVVTAFLLWRIWRGAVWSRGLLVAVSCVALGFTIALGGMAALGAPGIVLRSVFMFALYAGAGALLCVPAVRALARPASRAAMA